MAQTLRTEAKPTIEIFSPATLDKVGEVTVDSATDVQQAVQAARAAWQQWSALSQAERTKILLAARDLFIARQEEILTLICAENGKPRLEALSEFFYVCDVITFYAKNAKKFLQAERIKPHLLRNKKVTVHYEPRGVIGLITPWNFPFILTIGEAIPALVAGNVVIIKPSEWTPLIARLGCEILQQALLAAGLPPTILQVVNGYGATGGALVDAVDMIAFTGSVNTGKRIAARAAQRLLPISLELGGKDPMIICRDADLERAANAAVWGAFTNSGQVCISVERVYVDAAIADEFTQRVVAKTRALRQGFDVKNSPERVDIGAMTFPNQIDTVEAHIADARARGAQILTGGQRNPKLAGRFFEPTVLTNVDHSMQIMTEETFGPVLPIMRVKDEQEALRLANDSIYGLNASVWTKDKDKGERLAAQIQAGITCVNDVIVGFAVTDAPSGGLKESGIGKRHGRHGIRRFCHEQVIITDRFGQQRETLWYPYSIQTEKMLMRGIRFLFSNRLLSKVKALFGR